MANTTDVLTVHPGLVITNMTANTEDSHTVGNKAITRIVQKLYKIDVESASMGIIESVGSRNSSICFIHWAFTLFMKVCPLSVRTAMFKH